MGKLYGENKEAAAIAIALIMGNQKFKTIGVQSRLTPQRAYTSTSELKRTIWVEINNSKDFQITTTLDKKGKSPNTRISHQSLEHALAISS